MRKTSQTKVMATMALVALVVVVLVVVVVAARERKRRSWANGTRFCPRLLQQTGLD